MEALLAHCHEGTPPPEEQIQQLWELAQQAEPAVQPYLKECACCFAAGAYSAAIVAAWCAIAQYLRLVVEAVGLDVAQLFYREEDKAGQPFLELIKRGDKPLYIAYQRMRLLEDQFTGNVKGLDGLYAKRCQYAHPTGEKAKGPQEAFEYVTEARWLVTRRVEQERFQDISVLIRCAADGGFNLTTEKARELVLRVREDQRETLASPLNAL
jgi:hypothetical protein